MKKFLTVLLVIAVMFTFSFGSAFAVTPVVPNDNTKVSEQDVRDAINTAADAAIAAENVALAAYINVVMGNNTATEKGLTVGSEQITVTRSALTAATKSEKTDDALAAIEAKRTAMLLAVNAEIRACENYTGWFTTDTSNDDGHHAAGYAVLNAALANYDQAGTYGTTTNYGTAWVTTASAFTDAVAEAVFEEKVAKVEKVVADVNPESYSKEYKGTEKSNYDKVVEAIADANMVISTAKAAVNAAAVNAVWGVVNTQLGNFETAIYKAGVGEGDPTGTFVTTIAGIPKVADEPTEAAKLEWAKSLVLGTLTAQINDYKNTILTEQNNIIVAEQLKSAPKAKVIADANAVIADTKEATDAAIEIVTYLVNDAEEWSDLVEFYKIGAGSHAKTGFTPTAKKYTPSLTTGDVYYWLDYTFKFNGNTANRTFTLMVPAAGYDVNYGTYNGNYFGHKEGTYSQSDVVDIVEAVADLKDDAELLKATVQIDGAEYVAIEKALEDAIWDAYYGNAKAGIAGFTPVSALYNRQEALISSADKVVIAGKKYNSVDNWAKLDNSLNGTYIDSSRYYYDGTFEKKNYDEVRAILKETRTNIRAAATIADAEAAFVAGYDKLDAVLTMQDKATETSKPAYQTALAKAKKDIAEYVTYRYNLLPANKNTSYAVNTTTFTKALQANLEACYNAEELEKALADAKATVDGLKSIAELTAEKNALEAEIAKIPTTVTVADKELVGTLKDKVDDFGEYVAMTGQGVSITNTAKVEAAKTTIQGLERRAIQDALNEIGTVTLEDATAIADLTKVVDEYVAYYAGEDATNGRINQLYGELKGDKGAANNKTIADLSAKLREAQIKEFRAMVAKLPADGSDVAGLKAAREFYDALSRTAKYGANGAYYTSEYDKMVDLEKVVTGDAKAYVQDLKITARSTKTSKGVKVTIKADVQPLLDAGYTVEYKFYRSTKSNKNFGTAKVTKTENTYLNTSGKKGTKYYYKAKLVVKNAEGEVVATTPLTQCLYATRTF